jgi:hypothetical protein
MCCSCFSAIASYFKSEVQPINNNTREASRSSSVSVSSENSTSRVGRGRLVFQEGKVNAPLPTEVGHAISTKGVDAEKVARVSFSELSGNNCPPPPSLETSKVSQGSDAQAEQSMSMQEQSNVSNNA